MKLLDILSDAAARGVDVTILTNHYEPAPITLKWAFQENYCSVIGRFRICGLLAIAQDCDGDSSWWEVRSGKQVLAKGDMYICDPYYHFDAALIAAEDALRRIVRERIAHLRDGSAVHPTPAIEPIETGGEDG